MKRVLAFVSREQVERGSTFWPRQPLARELFRPGEASAAGRPRPRRRSLSLISSSENSQESLSWVGAPLNIGF